MSDQVMLLVCLLFLPVVAWIAYRAGVKKGRTAGVQEGIDAYYRSHQMNIK